MESLPVLQVTERGASSYFFSYPVGCYAQFIESKVAHLERSIGIEELLEYFRFG